VWGIDAFDLYTAGRDGSGMRRLTSYGVYTAEGVLSPDGRRIVFTSLKDGDLDIYTMNVDGTDVRRLTTTPATTAGRGGAPTGRRSSTAPGTTRPATRRGSARTASCSSSADPSPTGWSCS
jgi:Tol biopolymer transport system component